MSSSGIWGCLTIREYGISGRINILFLSFNDSIFSDTWLSLCIENKPAQAYFQEIVPWILLFYPVINLRESTKILNNWYFLEICLLSSLINYVIIGTENAVSIFSLIWACSTFAGCHPEFIETHWQLLSFFGEPLFFSELRHTGNVSHESYMRNHIA